jgi:hypothetical protein
MSKIKEVEIRFSTVAARFKNNKDTNGKILSDGEALYIVKNMTPTSKKYFKLKKDEFDAEHVNMVVSPETYRIFRDQVLGEICTIEVSDPNIRKTHKMSPAT